MNEEGAYFGRITTRVEKFVVPISPLIRAVKGFAFAPAAAGDDDRRRLRLRRTILHNQIRTVRYELGLRERRDVCGGLAALVPTADCSGKKVLLVFALAEAV